MLQQVVLFYILICYRQTYRHIDKKQVNRLTENRHTYRLPNKQTDRQTNGQTDKQSHILTIRVTDQAEPGEIFYKKTT